MLIDRLSDAASNAETNEAPAPASGRTAFLSLEIMGERLSNWSGDIRQSLRWREMRAKLIDPQIASYLGRIDSSSERGLIAEFPNALNAVRCAIDIQRDITAVDARSPMLAPTEVRMGVHFCRDVTAAGANAEGLRTVLAVTELAEAGEILVTAATQEQLVGVPEISAERLVPDRGQARNEDLGMFRIDSGQKAPRRLRPAIPGASLAVLPFSGGDTPENAYFTEGIVQDIVDALAATSHLEVISPTSAYRFRGADIRAIGRQLGVRYVLTGATRCAEKQLIVVPELIEAETNAVLWRQQFRIRREQVFDLEIDVARRIASALVPSLSNTDLQRIETKRTANFEAYELVIQSLHRMYRLKQDDFAMARSLLERAVEIDPGYAAAHTTLVEWHTLNIGQGYGSQETVARAEVMRAATSAVKIAPSDGRALAILGHCKAWLFRDYDSALDLFEQALTGSANSAVAWGWSTPTCSYLGDGTTAIAHAEYALRLCPYGPHASVFGAMLAFARYTNGDFEEAARWARRVMAVHPRYEANLRFLAASLAACGRSDEAAGVARLILAVQPKFSATRVAARYAYRDHARNRQLAEHLRLAGLPD